jgi:hypothetical protein
MRSPGYRLSQAQVCRPPERKSRCSRVLDCQAHGFKKGHLRFRGPARVLPLHDFAELSLDMPFVDPALPDWPEQIPGFAQAGHARIDHDQGAADGFGRDFLHFRGVGADGVEVDPRLEITIFEDRVLRSGRRAEDIRPGNRLARILCDADGPVLIQRSGQTEISPANHRVFTQICRLPAEHNFAGLDDVTAVGDLQGNPGVLLHQ